MALTGFDMIRVVLWEDHSGIRVCVAMFLGESGGQDAVAVSPDLLPRSHPPSSVQGSGFTEDDDTTA